VPDAGGRYRISDAGFRDSGYRIQNAGFNPQISPQRNGLRPDEIGFAFHWAGISLGKHFTGQADYNDCGVDIAKAAGFTSPSRFSLAGLH
jgi:hypothetical protein